MLPKTFLILCAVTCSLQSNLENYFNTISSPDLYARHLEDYVLKNQNNRMTKCRQDILIYVEDLFLKQGWSARMFDSGTKIPSGILQGNVVDLGTFDECMAVKSPSMGNPIYGKYCIGSIPIVKLANSKSNETQSRSVNPNNEISAMFATCLPHSCSPKDFENIYSNSKVVVKFDELLCQTNAEKTEFRPGDIVMISFLGIIVGIMILSTIYDIVLYYNNQTPRHSTLIAFSVLTNGKKLLETTSVSTHISCLHGIRVISMMWIILGHRYGLIGISANRNPRDLLKWISRVGNMYLMGGTVSVDTFLILSGLLVGYGFMTVISKGHKFNILKYYIHRYLRLTPVYAVLIFFHMTLLVYLGSGPFWPYITSVLSMSCEKRWWAALLYVQNYVAAEGYICIPQTWYLSVDTQLFLISPLILIPLKKWPKIGILIAGGLTIASIVYVFVLGYVNKYSGFILANQSNSTYQNNYYIATHTRAAPWLMGILLGYYIHQIKQHGKFRMNNLLVVSTWVVALGILATCTFTGHSSLTDYNRTAEAFYLALLRPGWAIGISIVIIMCVLEYGGPINWFLSLPVFQILSRLTYTMYLIHITMQVIVSFQERTVRYMNDLNSLYVYWGDYMFTLGASVLFTLAFESPIITLDKIIFGRTETKSKKPLKDVRQRSEF